MTTPVVPLTGLPMLPSTSTTSLPVAQRQQQQAAAAAAAASLRPSHVFTSEIQQMAFVVTGDKDVDDDVAQYIEDIVKAQLGELVVNARLQASRRGSRTIGPEDLIFLCRHNKPNVNRIRAHLRWKDARKKARESNEAAAGGAIDVGSTDDLDNVNDDNSNTLDRNIRLRQMQTQTPWDLEAIYGDFLPDDEDEEQQDDDSDDEHKQRLEHYAQATDKMTKEEYLQYADARGASFIYRKSKKFRDFLSLGSTIDSGLMDDVVDILGFLAYEMVNSLCQAALSHRRQTDLIKAQAAVTLLKQKNLDKNTAGLLQDVQEEQNGTILTKSPRKRTNEDDVVMKKEDKSANGGSETASPAKRGRKGTLTDNNNSNASSREQRDTGPRRLIAPTSLFSEPVAQPTMAPSVALSAIASGVSSATENNDKPIPSLEQVVNDKARIKLEDVNAGFLSMQREQTSLKACGLRNWRGGVSRIPTKFL
ncbi:Transcription initiation protein spt3 [Microbotryomycetes sp. JL221]|nr:Transcription initiation protein spt3 [Microbotryomycetes sp. JL221]